MNPTRVSHVRRVLRPVERYMRACSWWMWRHRVLILVMGLIGLVWWGYGTLTGREHARTEALCFLVVGLVPAFVNGVWFGVAPVSYERRVAGPTRRRIWKKWARKEWVDVAASCGLATKKPDGAVVVPRVLKRSASGETLTLKVRVQRGLTVDAITRALPAIATTANALAWSARTVAPGTVVLALTMRDALALPITAGFPEPVLVDALPIGRKVDGGTWRLGLLGRHTLVVGASGSGKGSIFWGIAANLGPAVHAGLVKLWGIDLKRGLEVRVGEGLFHAVADNPTAAVATLKAVLRVIDERGALMAGKSRLHQPSKGAPLHVVMIDEVAVLTAYADKDTKNEASRLLSEILTQGRAFGVLVVACVQDPRKEAIGMRGLFTQVIALRLRSAEEVRMVLGEGMHDVAPAHDISIDAPGTAYVVNDDGTSDKIRAAYWPDNLIRQVAHTYPNLNASPTALSDAESATAWRAAGGQLHAVNAPTASEPEPTPAEENPAPAPAPTPRAPHKPRSPRKPRAPRAPRTPRPADSTHTTPGGTQ